MAAAWPYCDAVVSAHNLDSLDDLLLPLSGTVSPGISRWRAKRVRAIG